MSLPLQSTHSEYWQAEIIGPGLMIVRIQPNGVDMLPIVVDRLLTVHQQPYWTVQAIGTDDDGWALWQLEKVNEV